MWVMKEFQNVEFHTNSISKAELKGHKDISAPCIQFRGINVSVIHCIMCARKK